MFLPQDKELPASNNDNEAGSGTELLARFGLRRMHGNCR